MRRLVVLLSVVLLLAAACSASGGAGDEATARASGGTPDFGGTTVEGTELMSTDYAGQDVILWFWAPW